MQGKTRLIAFVVASTHKTSVFPFSTIFRSTFFMKKETLFCQFDLTAYVVRGEKICVSVRIAVHFFTQQKVSWSFCSVRGATAFRMQSQRVYMNKKKSAHEWSCFTFTTKQFVTLNQVDFMLNTKCSSFSALQKRRERDLFWWCVVVIVSSRSKPCSITIGILSRIQ